MFEIVEIVESIEMSKIERYVRDREMFEESDVPDRTMSKYKSFKIDECRDKG